MYVKCQSCNADHDLTPTRMAQVIAAFQAGDMQSVTTNGLESKCLNTAVGNPVRDRSAGKISSTQQNIFSG